MKLYCDSSTKEACIVLEGQKPIIIPYPKRVTNNVGEYKAVILALRWAQELKLEQVELLTDSLLVVNQVNGEWKCRMEHLLPLRDKVRELAQFPRGITGKSLTPKVVIKWVSREENLAGRILG